LHVGLDRIYWSFRFFASQFWRAGFVEVLTRRSLAISSWPQAATSNYEPLEHELKWVLIVVLFTFLESGWKVRNETNFLTKLLQIQFEICLRPNVIKFKSNRNKARIYESGNIVAFHGNRNFLKLKLSAQFTYVYSCKERDGKKK